MENLNKKFKKLLTPKNIIFFLVFLTLTIVGISTLSLKRDIDKPELMSYNDYVARLENGDVNYVVYNLSDNYMNVAFHDDKSRTMTDEERLDYEPDEEYQVRVIYPAHTDFRKELLEHGALVLKAEATGASLLSQYGSLLFSVGMMIMLFFFLQRMSPMKGGTEYVTQIMAEDIDVSFGDVIGHEEVKNDLVLLVKQIKNGAQMKDLTHGILFEGAAGTGKTMLAKAVAHESGLNFISVSSSNLTELFVGMGARRVKEAFKKARTLTPCVLFFDEIDAVGAKRGTQSSNREYDQTINALLTELDGFSANGEIIVIAATNRSEDLDPALLRAGRFDRKVVIGLPKKWETRRDLFDHYLAKATTDETVNTELLAKQTVGFSGADIAAVCREARLISLSNDSDEVSHANLEEAIDKMVFKGNRSDEETHERDLMYVAYHEAGHAVMTLLQGEEISRISIVGMTSGVGGAVFQTDKDTAFETKDDVVKQIMIAYAGRASEQIRFGGGNITQGASNDITQATTLLVSYVSKLGYDSKIGLVDVSALPNAAFADSRVFDRVSELSIEFYDKTRALLFDHYSEVEKLAQHLLKAKTLSGDEAKAVVCISKQHTN